MKKAVVIMNLGTPVAPTKKAVRDFLREFLSDRRVVEVPRPVWLLILYVIILTFRTPRVTEAYKKIWGDGASPLRLITQAQATKLEQQLAAVAGENTAPTVTYAMAYSGPSLEQRVAELEQAGTEHILILPLYPQYSATTTGSIYDQVAKIFSRRRNIPQVQLIKQYFEHPLYIQALAESARQQWAITGKPDRLLMSFHSIPQSYADAGDPYGEQCHATAKLLAKALGLNDQQWAISFQSRLGFSKWLSPYTSTTVEKWGREKIAHVDVICPAFSADCLETLEEIQVENRELFIESGGGELNLIPCLNDQTMHIEMMAALVNQYLPSQLSAD